MQINNLSSQLCLQTLITSKVSGDVTKILGVFALVLVDNLDDFGKVRCHSVLFAFNSCQQFEALDLLQFIEGEACHLLLHVTKIRVDTRREFLLDSDQQLVNKSTEVNLTQKFLGDRFLVDNSDVVSGFES